MLKQSSAHFRWCTFLFASPCCPVQKVRRVPWTWITFTSQQSDAWPTLKKTAAHFWMKTPRFGEVQCRRRSHIVPTFHTYRPFQNTRTWRTRCVESCAEWLQLERRNWWLTPVSTSQVAFTMNQQMVPLLLETCLAQQQMTLWRVGLVFWTANRPHAQHGIH